MPQATQKKVWHRRRDFFFISGRPTSMGTSGTPLEYRYSALNSFEAGQTVALPVDAGVRDVLGQTSDHLVGAGGHPCPQLRVPEGGPGDFRRRTGDLGVMWNVPGRFGPQGPRVTTSKDDSNKRRLCVLQPTLVRRSWRPRQGVRAVPQGAQTSTGYIKWLQLFGLF